MDFFKIGEDHSEITLNTKLYSMDVIYAASYLMLDKAFFIFDGDPESLIEVKIASRKKPYNDKEVLEVLSKEFYNNLLIENYNSLSSNKKEFLRALMLKQSFANINLPSLDSEIASDSSMDSSCEEPQNLSQSENAISKSNDSQSFNDSDSKLELDDDDFDDDDFEFEDPDGIAIPWEEKYGDESANESEESEDEKDNVDAQNDSLKSKTDSEDIEYKEDSEESEDKEDL